MKWIQTEQKTLNYYVNESFLLEKKTWNMKKGQRIRMRMEWEKKPYYNIQWQLNRQQIVQIAWQKRVECSFFHSECDCSQTSTVKLKYICDESEDKKAKETQKMPWKKIRNPTMCDEFLGKFHVSYTSVR